MQPQEFAATLVKARRGDTQARDRLITAFYPSVEKSVHRQLALDMRRTRPWLSALFSTGDIVHEVFTGVLRDLDRFEGTDQSAFRGFLATTVAHRLLDMLRYHQAECRDGRRVVQQDDARPHVDLRDDALSPREQLEVEEAASGVRTALSQLRERDQRLLDLRFRDGATFPVIAREMGIPSADAARKAVCLAQARLLVVLRGQGDS